MPALDRILRLVAVAAVATFFGTMLTEGCVLVPFWRSVDAPAFLAWYAANGDRLLGFFGPVTTVAGLASLASAVVALRAGTPGRLAAAAAAAVFVAIVLMFPAYFEAANASFADGSLAAADVPAALATWGAWHWVRTALAGVSLALSMAALSQAPARVGR